MPIGATKQCYFGVDLTQITSDLHGEKLENSNKRQKIVSVTIVFLDKEFNIMKIEILPKLIYNLHALSVKIPVGLFSQERNKCVCVCVCVCVL